MNSTKKQSYEDYLERILMLSKSLNRPIRAIDIVNSFSYSRASVSIALKKLAQEGYIVYKDDQSVELTEDGLVIAEETYDRHQIITEALQYMGVSRETSEEDACKIEHVISKETFEALKRVIKK